MHLKQMVKRCMFIVFLIISSTYLAAFTKEECYKELKENQKVLDGMRPDVLVALKILKMELELSNQTKIALQNTVQRYLMCLATQDQLINKYATL